MTHVIQNIEKILKIGSDYNLMFWIYVVHLMFICHVRALGA